MDMFLRLVNKDLVEPPNCRALSIWKGHQAFEGLPLGQHWFPLQSGNSGNPLIGLEPGLEPGVEPLLLFLGKWLKSPQNTTTDSAPNQ